MMMTVKKFLAMKLKVLMPETANLTYRVNKLRSQGLSSRRFATQQARFGMARTRGGNGNVGRVPLDHVPEILTYRIGFSHVLREGLCRLAEGKHHIFCQSLVSIGSSPSPDMEGLHDTGHYTSLRELDYHLSFRHVGLPVRGYASKQQSSWSSALLSLKSIGGRAPYQ